jgi:hypothetical protein
MSEEFEPAGTRNIQFLRAAELAAMNLVGRVDVFVLAALATAYADIEEAGRSREA